MTVLDAILQSLSRGKESIRADGGIVMVGNFDVDVQHQQKIGHLFGPLPPEMRDDTAFQDRIHCDAPGWDVPKVSAQLFTNHFGAFAEALRASQPNATRLDPPPADPKCSQPPNAEAISSTNHRTETH